MAEHKLRVVRQEASAASEGFDSGGGGGDDGGMEARLTALEAANTDPRERLARIETRLEAVATRSDLHESLHSLTWKIIGSCATLVAITYYIATHIK